ncbi:MAG: cobaltochelatase subunit CobN [Candidatus Sigynarchaeota archaeon]
MPSNLRVNKKPSVVIVSSMVCTRNLIDAAATVREQLGSVFDISVFFVNDVETGVVSKSTFVTAIHDANVLMIDIRGNNLAAELIVETYEAMERDEPALFKEKSIVSLVGGNEEIRRLTKLGPFMARSIPSKKKSELGMDGIPDLSDLVKKGIRIGQMMKSAGKYLPVGSLKHARNWMLLMDYWAYGHAGVRQNLENMFKLVLRDYLGHEYLEVPEPQKFPPIGIYDPRDNRYYASTEEYHRAHVPDPTKQTVGFFFYGGIYFEQTLPVLESFMEKLSDYNLIPVFSESLENIHAHEKFFFKDGVPIVNAVINLQYFQINGGPFGGDNARTLALYRRENVPQFNPVILFDSKREEYEASTKGTIPINQVIAVVMPELDGRIEMLAAGTMQDKGIPDGEQLPVLEVGPIEENITIIAKRVRKWLDLRAKSNSEKKIAIILYDYPPGEAKLASASYLDVPSSIKRLLALLAREGFITFPLPDGKEIQDILMESGAINSPKHVDVKDYKGISIDAQQYSELLASLPSETRQRVIDAWGPPPGSIMVKDGRIRLPILQFGNVYICLQPARSEVTGDPVEYHDKDKPPHHQYVALYRYLDEVVDVDAIIHFGTHGTLEFLPGKECLGNVRDDNIALLGRIPNIYIYHVGNTSESAIAKRRSNAVIINHAGPAFESYNLNPDLLQLEDLVNEWQDARSSNGKQDEGLLDNIREIARRIGIEYSSMAELEALIPRYKLAAVPIGLHVLGETFTVGERKKLITRALLDSVEAPTAIDAVINRFGKNEHAVLHEIEPVVESIITNNMAPPGSKGYTEMAKKLGIGEKDLEQLARWVADLSARMEDSYEERNIIRALEGGYIEPGFGGDPIRTPSIFPTGRNSFGFDPRLIPSSIAFKRGEEIANRLLQQYKDEHGTWPETTSVVLWGFETMKTGGETVGQIFSYMGVKPVKKKSVWTTELEIIPLAELGHPRINVVVTICGIFRDTFPYILDLINRAIELVSNLDEPVDQNYVKKATLDLEARHVQHPIARIFGPSPSRYNTNITEIINAGAWKEEGELATNYIETMGFAYLKNQEVEAAKDAFAAQVTRIELLSQVRDSNEFHVTDLDHYYEFTGGLARAREHLAGSRASVFIADTSRKRITVETIDKSINEGAVTRTLNPTWIHGMLKHKHSGGQKIAERVENFLGMAATTHEVSEWIWDKTYAQYIENEEIRAALIENNRFAMMDVVKTILQASQRGYWNASDEQIDTLKKLYLEMESWLEITYQ